MVKDRSIELVIYMLFGGGSLTTWGLKRYFQMRKTQDTPTSKIASAAQGFVEVQGYTWHDGQVVSNIDGRNTVYYKLKLEKRVGVGKNAKWEKVAERSLVDPFYIVDTTGALLVSPHGFDYNIQNKTSDWKSLALEKRIKVSKFLTRQNDDIVSGNLAPLEPGFFSPQHRCIESYILLGSPIIVHGHLSMSQNFEKQKYQSGMNRFFKIVCELHQDRKRARALLDVNSDNRISESELRTGFHGAALSAMQKKIDEAPEVPFFGLLKPHLEHKSFIADCHQKHLISRIGSWNFLLIFGGAAIFLCGIWFFLWRYKINV